MKSLSRILIPLVLVVLFGKFIPLLLAGLIPVILVIIVQAAIKEGRMP